MTPFDPDDLARWSGGEWTRRPGASLGAFAIDTRQIRRGQVFVALKTQKRDGHDFLAAAAGAGAAAALVSRADSALELPQLVVGEGGDTLRAFQQIAQAQRERFQAAGGRVIGITGSVGKTSTKNLLAALLGAAVGEDQVLATEGNLNNHLGVPLTLTRIDPARHRFAVIEAGISEPGEMAALAGMIRPDVAIITAVAAAHLAALGDIAGVAREKAVLAAQVGAGGLAIFPAGLRDFVAFKTLRVRCLCAEQSDGLIGKLRREENFTIVPHALMPCGEEQTDLLLADQDDPRNTPTPFQMLPTSSKGMANNAALAIRAALHLGVDSETIRLGPLRKWSAGSLRGEWRREPGREIYLDCYNANPASMADALDAFYAQAPAAQPRLLVLGGMEELGAQAAMHHRALGRSLRLRPQDRVFAVGPEAAALREGALESRHAHPGQIEVVAGDLGPVRAAVACWRGAIFLKASRRYRLETLLDAGPSPAGAAHSGAAAADEARAPAHPQ